MYAIRSYYEVISAAHKIGAIVVVDGAQGIVHEKVDVEALDADFYVFSGHKLYAPAGIVITSYSIHYTKLYDLGGTYSPISA